MTLNVRKLSASPSYPASQDSQNCLSKRDSLVTYVPFDFLMIFRNSETYSSFSVMENGVLGAS